MPSRRTAPDRGIRTERRAGVVRITLDRPRSGNRVTAAMAAELVSACERCEEEDCRVVLLTASGRDFCLGLEGAGADWPDSPRVDFVGAVARITRPVVAVVRGRAEAEGLELLLAADLRIASPGARFAMPQVGRGSLPRFGGTQRLPRVVGPERAMRMILLGEVLRTGEARTLGLLSRVERRAEVAGTRLAAELAGRGPVALRFAKEAVRRARDLSLDDGARFEHDLYSLLQTTDDRAEGIRSFLAKRRPVFRGR